MIDSMSRGKGKLVMNETIFLVRGIYLMGLRMKLISIFSFKQKENRAILRRNILTDKVQHPKRRSWFSLRYNMSMIKSSRKNFQSFRPPCNGVKFSLMYHLCTHTRAKTCVKTQDTILYYLGTGDTSFFGTCVRINLYLLAFMAIL